MSDSHGMFGVSGTGDTSGYSGLERIQVTPGSSERPYGSYFDEVADDLERAYPEFSDAIEKVVVDRGELTLHVKRERLVEVAKILRVSPLTIKRWGKRGKLPAIRINSRGDRRYKKEAVLWLLGLQIGRAHV